MFPLSFTIFAETFAGFFLQSLTNTSQAAAENGPPLFPTWVRTAAILLGGGLATYVYRQWKERKKLLKALKTEIRCMDGLETCAASMDDIKKPSSTDQGIRPKDVPAKDSIPTRIFEDNTQRLGLLKEEDLATVVRFYSRVIRYKEIIAIIRADKEIPEPDANELWSEISDLEESRGRLFGEGWLGDDSTDRSN